MTISMSILSTIIIVFAVSYAMVLSLLGIRQARKDKTPVTRQEALLDQKPDPTLDLCGFHFYYMIPALDEERVIGGTVAAMMEGQPNATILVIDDGSEDRTGEIVDSFVDTGRVIRLTRVSPNARKGKARALNNGLLIIREDVKRRGLDPSNVIVGVADADGRMTPNASAVVAQKFAQDPSIGGLQLVVRIRNRGSAILMFQDIAFWVISGLMQLGREPMGSVSMGGNGQFTRLSALDEVGAHPWTDSLTEDLDLGLSLSVLGWRCVGTPGAYVTQQGVNNLRAMLRQHTRWYQGHMMSMKRLPELARSRYLPTARFLELSAYLAVPWALVLPWSILQQFVLYQAASGHVFVHVESRSVWPHVAVGVLWYVISFFPQLFWGILYWRRSSTVSFPRAVVMAHLMIPWSYTGFICIWRALGRIIVGRNEWAKTAREQEDGPPLNRSATKVGGSGGPRSLEAPAESVPDPIASAPVQTTSPSV